MALALLAVKSSLLLLFSLAAARAMKKASGRVHHLLWSITFVGLLLLPFATVLPKWQLAVIPALAVGASARSVAVSDDGTDASFLSPSSAAIQPAGAVAEAAPAGRVERAEPRRDRSAWPAMTLVGLLWSLGVLLVLASVLASLRSSRALMRRSERVTDPEWLRLAAEIRQQLGVGRAVVLRMSPLAISPMTAGVLLPRILLPAVAAEWCEERRRIVLQHELIHVARHDVLRQLAVRVALALYWFHPLAWLAARRAAAAREQACDEGVLGLGARASAYATHLMALADDLVPGPERALALPIIESTLLEERLMAILKHRLGPANLLASLALALALVLVLLSVASAEPVAVSIAGAPTAESSARIASVPPAAEATTPSSSEHGDDGCWPRSGLQGDFCGTMNFGDDGTTEFVGFYDDERVVQQNLLGARICLRAHGDVEFGEVDSRILSIGTGGWLLLAAESEGRLQELRIGEGMHHTWKIDGVSRPFDAEAEHWRDQMLAVVTGISRAAWLRGRDSSLRGEISSVRGERSSLRGSISSLRGERSSLRGQISSIRGERSSLRGEISSIRGHLSSLRGGISSHRGAISSLRAGHRGGDDREQDSAAVIAGHEAAITELEGEIANYEVESRVVEVERRIEGLGVEARVAQIEGELAGLDVAGREAQIEAEISALEVDKRVHEIETELEHLDATNRVLEIERELEPAVRQLKKTIDDMG